MSIHPLSYPLWYLTVSWGSAGPYLRAYSLMIISTVQHRTHTTHHSPLSLNIQAFRLWEVIQRKSQENMQTPQRKAPSLTESWSQDFPPSHCVATYTTYTIRSCSDMQNNSILVKLRHQAHGLGGSWYHDLAKMWHAHNLCWYIYNMKVLCHTHPTTSCWYVWK